MPGAAGVAGGAAVARFVAEVPAAGVGGAAGSREGAGAADVASIAAADAALAGETTVATSSFFHEDSWTFEVPIEALTKTEGRITIVSSRTFVPAERSGVADRRQLGLRVFELRVDRVGLR